MAKLETVKEILARIYGGEKGELAFRKILPLIKKFPVRQPSGKGYFSENDVVLITYGDSLRRAGERPLVTFHQFAKILLKGSFSTIHFLPFFPYSSDDGFSVIDFYSVNPELGTWNDILNIGQDFRLMFDFVLNHISAQSEWFQNYLTGKPGFEELAIEVDPSIDLSMVTRPRALPLLTPFQKADGTTVHVWTTFSADQIDLNFKSLDVLEKMIGVLLYYVKQGATILRLDAIAYLWKEIGTNCIHLPQTHDMVKLFRAILDLVAPDVMILTETNVPHTENISYFGNGKDEAQMVYNFTLPPLLFHTFAKENAAVLSQWAKGLHLESETNTFFNFTASHDGIGVRPLEGILPSKEIDDLIDIVKANGGHVSYKQNPDGSQSPYELNITYVDAMRRKGVENDPLHPKRFLASQAIQYVLPGVPATYIHSLVGSRNWIEGMKQTGRARTINRQKLQADDVLREINNAGCFRSKIFHPYIHMIKTRKDQRAFHPKAGFEVLDVHHRIFAIKRFTESQEIYAVTNISSQSVSFSLAGCGAPRRLFDLLTGSEMDADPLILDPYDYVWLTHG